LRKPLKSSHCRGAGGERQFERRRSLRRLNSADGGSRLRARPDLQPDKEIIPARRSLRARDAERWQIAPNMGRFQIVPGKQQHHLGRESHPPVRRFDFCDGRCSLLGRLLWTGPQSRAAASECDNGQKREKSSEKSLRSKIPKMAYTSFHRESIRKKNEGCQSRSSEPDQQVCYFRGSGDGAKTNSPNASGTWKLGAGVPVGCQAE
jgi:hypothetical protein